MKWLILLNLVFFSLFADLLTDTKDSFISNKEYGQMLYFYPRGIGCNRCHGDNGKGKLISIYKDNNKTKILKAGDITVYDFKRFKKGVNKKNNSKSIMPEYFLTDDELRSIYLYLSPQKIDKPNK
ncbi:MAG: hypothetical protein B1H07_02885 [Campylobacteraceae bacterium 4484_166]|nr:MAG: hypothetical protein B1H07_02885 [Campylobacteraceae bacterium 4484_166]